MTTRQRQYWGDDDPTAPRTPWGSAQDQVTIDEGVFWFGTASHGGLAIVENVAKEVLSPTAYELGELWEGSLWYEEDVAYTIPFYEHLEWSVNLGMLVGLPLVVPSELKPRLRKTIHEYFPFYLSRTEGDSP